MADIAKSAVVQVCLPLRCPVHGILERVLRLPELHTGRLQMIGGIHRLSVVEGKGLGQLRCLMGISRKGDVLTGGVLHIGHGGSLIEPVCQPTGVKQQ